MVYSFDRSSVRAKERESRDLRQKKENGPHNTLHFGKALRIMERASEKGPHISSALDPGGGRRGFGPCNY
jgi:hypothetical protein